MRTEQQYSAAEFKKVLIWRISEAISGGLTPDDCATLIERGPGIAAGIAKERPELAEAIVNAKEALQWSEIDEAYRAGLRAAGRRSHSQIRLRMALGELDRLEKLVQRCATWVHFAEQGLEQADMRSAGLALHLLQRDWR